MVLLETIILRGYGYVRFRECNISSKASLFEVPAVPFQFFVLVADVVFPSQLGAASHFSKGVDL